MSINHFLNEKIDYNIWNKFITRLSFCNIDVCEILHFYRLKKILQQKKNTIIYYCAVPPNILKFIVKGLRHENLNIIPARIILEKPLGICLNTSKKINDQITQHFLESQIFRIDHYLGKESVLNLLAFRFANSFFFNNWNHQTIDHIQITVSEEIGIENRWNYFDKMGQMRDMVQNHLLQILTIVTMDQPKNINAEHIQHEKIKILRSLNYIDINDIKKRIARGQYCSGFIQGKKVSSYLEENGANKKSNTETFIAIKINLNHKKWLGVPFYLRTGKRLAKKHSEIVVVFKKTPIDFFKNSHMKFSQNKLIIQLEPHEKITMNIFNKMPGLNKEYQLEQSYLNTDETYKKNSNNFIDAYERLLIDSMAGIKTLFVSRIEVEESWKWIDPIIESWTKNKNDSLQLYQSGTYGPMNADLLMLRDGRYWHKYH